MFYDQEGYGFKPGFSRIDHEARLIAALRLILWNKGRTYAQVARLWGCSELEARRQLISSQIPLSDLLSLLDWLDMSLADLQMLAESNRTLELIKAPPPSPSQEHYRVMPPARTALGVNEGQILNRRTGRFNLMREEGSWSSNGNSQGNPYKRTSLLGRVLNLIRRII